MEQIDNIAKKMGRTIKGYSTEIQRFVGNVNFKELQNKMQQVESLAEETGKKIGSVKYDSKSIEDYIKAYNENMDLHPRMKMADKMQLSKEKIGNQDFYMKAHINTSEAKREIKSFRGTIEQEPTTNGFSSFFNSIGSKITQIIHKVKKIGTAFNGIKPSISGIGNSLNRLPKITLNINNNIKAMSTKLKQGLGHILKYAGALLSIRGIYGLLRSSASAWLSSQNEQAQQLSANIEYLKYSMGSAFAPIIEYITNLVYQLMKAVQSLVYAFSGINIFAKATASSMNKTAGSAKQASKSLSSVHSDINNVSENNNSGGGTTSPNIDLWQMDNQMSSFAQKLYDFFKPLKDSWEVYGPQIVSAFKNAFNGIGQAISAMWSSIERIFTNGTIYSIIANILNSIGKVGEAWANAWKNDDNGTEIIQGIANMIDDITNAILNLVSSTGFQVFLDGVLSAFSGIVQFIEPIASGFTEMAEKIIEIVGTAIGEVLKTVGDALQTIAQNETVAEILKAIGEAIAIVVAGIIAWNVAQVILNGLMGLFTILTSPITLIILGIIAAITAIILIIKNWGTIAEWFGNLWKTITDKLQEIWTAVKEFFINLWQGIVDTVKSVWNGIKDFLANLWNGIKTVASTVWNAITSTISNVINGIRNTISNVLNAIKTVWSNIWNGIKNVVSNVWNGIWSCIKGVINSILGGIEKFVNGTIRGINKLLSVISKVANAVGSLIGLNPINLQISTISLPRLAKGGVLTEATAVVAGEYSGAKTNPEIVAPQNIMKETFEDVLSNYSGNNGQPIQVTVQYLGKTIFDDTIRYINDKTRRTGKDTIITVGG